MDAPLPNAPKPLLTLVDISRKLGIAYPRCAKALRNGTLIPDYIAGKLWLFHPGRVADAARLFTETL
jgi:hypothetical protein